MIIENNRFNDFFNTDQNQYGNRFQINTVNNYLPNNNMALFKKGGGIKIKKQNRGLFTKYCGGNVTNECIKRGKNSPDPKIRKRATFADNARKWKHQLGGILTPCNLSNLNNLINNYYKYNG